MDSFRQPADARLDDRTALCRPPQVHLLVVQPTPFCNINCRYCYLSNRSDRATISDSTLESLFGKLFASGWTGGQLDIAWHAGEPTVLPVAFYQRAFAIVERLRPRGLAVTHNFQTNATLLTEAWCELFRRPDVQLGVSVDGPQRLNDLNRLSRGGRSTFDKVMAGVRLLRAGDVPFHTITVLSGESLGAARELHDFFASEGIEHVGFNLEESEGDHVSGLPPGATAAQAYKAFLAEFWTLAAQGGRVKSIREIDRMLGAVFHNPATTQPGIQQLNMLTEPFGIINVDHAGNVATYSPELLGQTNAEYEDFVIGNVNTHHFAQMAASPNLLRMNADIQAGVQMCREACPYFGVCGGGEPVNKFYENGTFRSTVTDHCRLTRMAVADLVAQGPYAA